MSGTPRRIPNSVAIGLLGLTFIGLVWLPLFVELGRDCLPSWDLGIYAQALHQLGWHDLNPWVSVRQVHIFNDHFDPVLLLVAPLAQSQQPALAALWVELGFVVAAALWIASTLLGANVGRASALTVAALLLFGAGAIQAVHFPVHPTTWSVLPLTAVGLALAFDRPRAAAVWGLSLLLFKEEMVFAVFLLGAALWFRARGPSVALLLASFFWGTLVFVVRPRWLGETIHYDEMLLAPWLRDPAAAADHLLLSRVIGRDILHLAVPFIPIAFCMWRRRVRPSFAALLMLAPLATLRLLKGGWSAHYGIAISACGVAAILPLLRAHKELSRWTIAATLALLVAMQGQFLWRRWGDVVWNIPKECPATPARAEEIRLAHDVLGQTRTEPVYAEGNLIPRLAALPDVRHLGIAPPPEHGTFWLFFEHGASGRPWPLKRPELETRVNELRRRGRANALVRGAYVELWRVDDVP